MLGALSGVSYFMDLVPSAFSCSIVLNSSWKTNVGRNSATIVKCYLFLLYTRTKSSFVRNVSALTISSIVSTESA